MINSWAAPGVECQCIHEGAWYASIIEYMVGLPIDGPKFMQILKIKDVRIVGSIDPAHDLKLEFIEFPGEMYCVCQFVPLQKIEDKVEDVTKAPVDETV